MTGSLTLRGETDELVAAATAGDEPAFSQLASRYRPELQAHALRLLGSREDSEDAVQETLLRAWRRRETFRGRSSFRAWLYGIATNTCLSVLERRARRAQVGPGSEGPSAADPAALLETVAAGDTGPDDDLAARETVELAVLAAVRHLPPRQRAVLLLGDLLSWSAQDTADLLGTSVAAVNSARQRARATLRSLLPTQRLEWNEGAAPSAAERALLRHSLAAAERGDAHALAALARQARLDR